MSPEYETKFIFHRGAADLILRWFENRCKPDPSFPEGTVSSIYFDTVGWRFLNEKINGDYLKTKVRLRWYADIQFYLRLSTENRHVIRGGIPNCLSPGSRTQRS